MYDISMSLLFMALPTDVANKMLRLFGDTHQIHASDENQLLSIVNGLILSLYAPHTNVEIAVINRGYMSIYDFVEMKTKIILNVYVGRLSLNTLLINSLIVCFRGC